MTKKRGVSRQTEHTEKISSEAKMMMKQQKRGYWRGKHLSEEHKHKLSLARKGRKRSKQGHTEKLAAAHRGKKLSQQTKDKISASQKGHKPTEQHIEN